VGDKVVVSLPGAVLPGGFAIAARKTYGHVSDGMICSARELGLSDDHEGIIRLHLLGIDAELGSDAIALLGLVDDVLDVSVLPDRGYAMSLRGLARELAHRTGWSWRDPANIVAPVKPHDDAVSGAITDTSACTRLVLRTVTDFQINAASPLWMQRRLHMCGMRSISLAVDITNYVMLELGQPLHAFDADKLQGTISVRRAGSDSVLVTLDGVERQLDSQDIVIADESGAVALAGTMGGESTEISTSTSRIVIEAARFNAPDIARTSRSHRLSSEASRRFERGVDSALAPIASARAVQLLQELGGARELGATEVTAGVADVVIDFDPDFVSQYVGAIYSIEEVERSLESVGCLVDTSQPCWKVTIPSWRPDLGHPVDLVEEVARLCGFDRIPSVLPVATAGTGTTVEQHLRASLLRSLAESGLVEVLNYPFMGGAELDVLRIPSDDARRNAVALSNPISLEQPLMRTTLLPPLLACARRNLGRGHSNTALFEMGKVVLPESTKVSAPILQTDNRPSDDELESLYQAVPAQPTYVAGVMFGEIEQGQSILASKQSWAWHAAISVVISSFQKIGIDFGVVALERDPWHPGRSAALTYGSDIVGFAGEIHPGVCETLGLPRGTSAFECDLSALFSRHTAVKQALPVRTFPPGRFDVAFVADSTVSARTLQQAIQASAGDLLVDIQLFDVYQGDRIPAGHTSYAFSLEFRAMDRTLTDTDLSEALARVVEHTERECGVALRN
jgi:phenylalanyl-tRNA synthetase beta chain